MPRRIMVVLVKMARRKCTHELRRSVRREVMIVRIWVSKKRDRTRKRTARRYPVCFFRVFVACIVR